MAKQPRAELDIDAAGGVGKDVASQRGQRHLEQHDHDETDADHVQRGVAAVDQHLVHHHLEEQRRDQGKQLQHEADRQHLQQQLAVLDDGGDEPGEVELRHLAGQRGARREEDQLTRPAGLQLLQVQLFRSPHARGLDQHLGAGSVVVRTGQDEELGMALGVFAHRNRWRGGFREPVGLHLDPLGLQAELAGRQQDFLRSHGSALCGELMGQLCGVRRHVVQARQHHQTDQRGILDGFRLAPMGLLLPFLPHLAAPRLKQPPRGGLSNDILVHPLVGVKDPGRPTKDASFNTWVLIFPRSRLEAAPRLRPPAKMHGTSAPPDRIDTTHVQAPPTAPDPSELPGPVSPSGARAGAPG